MNPQSLIVIGGGPGGYAAALEASRRGLRVTLIEHRETGGTCLNRGCIPSKFILSRAKQCADALNLAHSGVQFRLEQIRMRALVDGKNEVVSTLRKRMDQAAKSASLEQISGTARFLSPNRVEILSEGQAAQTREADAVILATGTSPIIPPTFPKLPNIFDSATILDLDYLPSHLVVVGGGYIGCELACAFQGLGSKVTLIEKERRLLPVQPEFESASTLLRRSFESRGLTVWTQTAVKSLNGIDDRRLKVTCSNGEIAEANAVLLALGRAPHFEGLGLENTGLELENGRLPVDSSYRTAVPSIYAIGDLINSVPLAHTASREGEMAVTALCGEKVSLDYSLIPRCVYTWPELAAVGMTEEQAKQSGSQIRIDRYHMAASAKAMVEQETEGVWMIYSDAMTRKIRGAQVVGPHASELIHVPMLAIRAGLTATDIAGMVFAHPTLAEGFREAMLRALAAPRRAQKA